jgi:tetratricopeptide (TPR) repeat protein
MIKSEYAFLFETPFEQNKYLMQILSIDDQQPVTYYMLGGNYNDMGESEKAILAYEKGIEVYEKWGIKPTWLNQFYSALLTSYIRTDKYEEGKKLLQKYQNDYPGIDLNSQMAILSFIEGDTVRGNGYVDQWLTIQNKNSASEVSIISRLISVYSYGHIPSKAKEYSRKLLSLQSLSLSTLNGVTWVLLSDNRNANEALELAEKMLALSPENYQALHRKGWALYELGRYGEALELLQKSWDLRMKTAVYNHEAFLHLEAARKAVANKK